MNHDPNKPAKLLFQITEQMLHLRPPAELIQTVSDALSESLQIDACLHLLWRDGRLCQAYHHGIDEASADKLAALPIGQSPCAWVAENQQPLYNPDLTAGTDDPLFAALKPLGARSYLGLPLVADGNLLGTLAFISTRPDAFDATDRQLLHTAARLLAATIARRYDQREREEHVQVRAQFEHHDRRRDRKLQDYQAQLRSLASKLVLAEQRERDRISGELHDHLAQLLTGCKLGLASLKRHVPGADGQEELAEIDDYLDQSITYTRTLMAELSPPVVRHEGIGAACQHLARLMRPHLRIDVVDHSEGCHLSYDLQTLLYRSLRELLLNVARHAHAESASITLDCNEDNFLELSVIDRGRGFAMENPRLSLSDDGGFGLFQIQERMEQLGGALEIESKPGKGTRVLMRVPVTSTEPAVNDDVAPNAFAPVGDRSPNIENAPPLVRVLLVDDHETVRRGIRRLVQDDVRLKVVGEAGSGEEAITLAEELEPDVVLMDVNLPGISGMDATRQLAARLPQVRIIGLSMHDHPQVAESMRRAGAVDYLCKDCQPRALREAIWRALGADVDPNE